MEDLDKNSKEIRRTVLSMFYKSGHGHLAPALSCVEILTVLFMDPEIYQENPRFILSKGHATATLYAIYAMQGKISTECLRSFYDKQSHLASLYTPLEEDCLSIPTGSLGQGICFATGLAKGILLKKQMNYVYCVLGDGEMQEGCVWEAAMFAGNHQLDNLIVILDNNNIQGTNSIEKICPINPIADKWISFGFEVNEVDGHNCNAIRSVISKARLKKGKPHLIIAHTTKGKGVSFIENHPKGHMMIPKGAQWLQVCNENGIEESDLELK